MTTTRVQLSVAGNQGYAPDQIPTPMTLGDLLYLVQEAINNYGEDAEVITHDTGHRRGAPFGAISVYEQIEPVREGY